MNAESIKQEIRKASFSFARQRGLPIDESHSSALIFSNLKDNFHPESYNNILSHPDWLSRINKHHPNVSHVKEMQSSNSSDALLMNIFCHPDVKKWKGVTKIMENDLQSIEFGFSGNVRLSNNTSDKTEIDMALSDAFCEAKLTETDFTQKNSKAVENYADLKVVFHDELLQHNKTYYGNYQIIRNLLASSQHCRRHILICDERRPDLVRRYMTTVSCLQDAYSRKNCKVIFWQEIVSVCGKSLREWIEEKYGM